MENDKSSAIDININKELNIQVSKYKDKHSYVYTCIGICVQYRNLLLHICRVAYKLATVECALATPFVKAFATRFSVAARAPHLSDARCYQRKVLRKALRNALGQVLEKALRTGFVSKGFAEGFTTGAIIRLNK